MQGNALKRVPVGDDFPDMDGLRRIMETQFPGGKPPDENAENAGQRRRRIALYERLGMRLEGHEVLLTGLPHRLMSTAHLFPEENRRRGVRPGGRRDAGVCVPAKRTFPSREGRGGFRLPVDNNQSLREVNAREPCAYLWRRR